MDPYLYAHAPTLRNRFEITDNAELIRVESEYTGYRLMQFERHPIRGQFDFEHLQSIHRHIFRDVYEWAGELRTTYLAKYEYGLSGRLSVFTEPQLLAQMGKEIFSRLPQPAALIHSSAQVFTQRILPIYAAVNTLHPFREGNGRAERAFFRYYARACGHNLSFAGISRSRWVRASVAAHFGDLHPLERVFEFAVDGEARARFHIFESTFEDLRRTGEWDWQEEYISVPVPGTRICGIVALTADDVSAVICDGRVELVRTQTLGASACVGDSVDVIEPQR